jgi:hypothetical protein
MTSAPRVALNLVGSDLGSRNNIGLEVAVDVRGVSRICALHVAGNLDSRRRVA